MKPFKAKLTKHTRYSELSIEGTEISIRCTIGNAYSTRNRRQFLLTLYRSMIRHLKFVRRSTIHHDHLDGPEIFGRDEFARLSTKQAIDVTNSRARLGYFIRGVRTKIGKTQKEFAEELGISASYLSQIEKARRVPGKKVVQKIYENEHLK